MFILVNTLTGEQHVISNEENKLLDLWISEGLSPPQSQFQEYFMPQLKHHYFIFDDEVAEAKMEPKILEICREEHRRQQMNIRNATSVLTYD